MKYRELQHISVNKIRYVLLGYFPTWDIFLVGFCPLRFCSLGFFPHEIFSSWDFYLMRFFPHEIFSSWDFFLVGFFPRGIFSYMGFVLMGFYPDTILYSGTRHNRVVFPLCVPILLRCVIIAAANSICRNEETATHPHHGTQKQQAVRATNVGQGNSYQLARVPRYQLQNFFFFFFFFWGRTIIWYGEQPNMRGIDNINANKWKPCTTH